MIENEFKDITPVYYSLKIKSLLLEKLLYYWILN